jgi:hypothetical protein
VNDINVIEWPPKGADISPIEAFLGEMQRRAKKRYSEIKIQDELREFVSELVFEEQFTNFIKKCYDDVQSKWWLLREARLRIGWRKTGENLYIDI